MELPVKPCYNRCLLLAPQEIQVGLRVVREGRVFENLSFLERRSKIMNMCVCVQAQLEQHWAEIVS